MKNLIRDTNSWNLRGVRKFLQEIAEQAETSLVPDGIQVQYG